MEEILSGGALKIHTRVFYTVRGKRNGGLA